MIPVLIPARNEAARIGSALDKLADQSIEIEPLVLANGCSDETVEISRDRGATVLETSEGKMAALQHGLDYLGARAIQPLLILDGDSAPLSKDWAKVMVGAAASSQDEQPLIGWGPIRFNNGTDCLSDSARTMRSYQILISDKNKERARSMHGANVVLHLKRIELLKNILELPNYWPGEDRAIRDTVIESGGVRAHVLNPKATVEIDASRLPSLASRLKLGHSATSLDVNKTYLDEAAAGSLAYKPAF